MEREHSTSQCLILLLMQYIYDTLLSKLRDLHISDNASEEIINDIFGKITSGEHQLGLVDAEDDDDFDVKLEPVKITWKHYIATY